MSYEKKITPIVIYLLCMLVVGVHSANGNPNASFTHIYILQSDGTTADLINGGIANVYANQDIVVSFIIYNPDLDIRQGSYLYILWGYSVGNMYQLSKGSSVTDKWTWNSHFGEAYSYSEHVELWWFNNGKTVLQDDRNFFISTSKMSAYNLNIKLIDQANRPVSSAVVSIQGYSASTSKVVW